MRFVIPLPLYHDKIPPPRPSSVMAAMTVLFSALFVVAGVLMLMGWVVSPGGSVRKTDAIYGVLSIIVFGYIGVSSGREWFARVSPVGSEKVVLDEEGVRHPHFRELIPWRDITGAGISTVPGADGGITSLMTMALIDDPVRYPGGINIHASIDEDPRIPSSVGFPLTHSAVAPDELLAWVTDKIATHRA